jgi:hypothetical protein
MRRTRRRRIPKEDWRGKRKIGGEKGRLEGKKEDWRGKRKIGGEKGKGKG